MIFESQLDEARAPLDILKLSLDETGRELVNRALEEIEAVRAWCQDNIEPDPESQCCGMPPLGEIFNDFAICSGCKEQADFSPQEE